MLRCSLLSALFSTAVLAAPATLDDARKFIDEAETRLLALNADAQRADWVKSTYITDDTEALAAQADERSIAVQVQLVKEAQRFSELKLPADLARKFHLLKVSLTVAPPADPTLSSELTRVVAGMEGTYGKGKYCKSGKCLDLEELSNILANSRNRP